MVWSNYRQQLHRLTKRLTGSLAAELGATLFANPCAGCQRLCRSPLCNHCCQRLQACRFSPPCWQMFNAVPLLAWGEYRGELKRAIANLKYHNQRRLAQVLGQWLGEAWLAQTNSEPAGFKRHPSQPSPLVVPIPLHPDKLNQRGFNQAELIAESFCRVTQLPLAPQGLVRNRATLPQFGLSAVTRNQNLDSAFSLGPALKLRLQGRLQGQRTPPPVLLLDDIYTTGATMQAAVAALQSKNVPVAGLVAVALTPKYGTRV